MLLRDIIFPKHKKEKTLLTAEYKKEAPVKKVRDLLFFVIAACVVLLVITLTHLAKTGVRLEKNIVEGANKGFGTIVQGARALQLQNWEMADQFFKEAGAIFTALDNKTWFSSNPFYPNMRNPIVDTGNVLIHGGKNLSKAGELFTAAFRNLNTLPEEFFAAQKSLSLVDRLSLTEKLKQTMPKVAAATAALKKAYENFSAVSENFIPAEIRPRFQSAKNALEVLIGFMKIFEEDTPALLKLLGDKEPHTVLILLQNNHELRPTGGFIGNYMILETNDGYLTKSDVFDVYSADHQLNEVVTPPAEILAVNQRWFLRDSNYSAHFPLSADKAAWFLEKENGPGVDTVIAIDQSFIEKLIALTGPVAIPELKKPLTNANFSFILSYITEAKLTGRENPKAVVHSFIQEFQKKVFADVDPGQLFFALKAAIESKHLLAYSRDPEVQAFFERRGGAGLMRGTPSFLCERTAPPGRGDRSEVGSCGSQPNEVEHTNKEDYLNIVHTSIGGNKNDAYISETIRHDTFLHSDGSIIDEVIISRTNHWNNETEKKLQSLISSFGFSKMSKNVAEILGRSRNLHALRIYVPKGTVLEKGSDSGITSAQDEEIGKTYFSARMEVPVGETKSLTLRFRLPFKLTLSPVDTYTFTIQKQAGQDGVTFQKRIFPESRVLNFKYFPEEGSFDPDGVWNYETELAKDLTLVSVWGK